MAISLTTAVSLLQRTRRPAARRRADVQLGFDALSDLYYRYWGEYFHLALREPDAAQDADALARDYDRTHERYLAAVRGQGAERILEVSCGGGALSAWLADRTGASVVGVDQSAGQLSRARQRTAGGQRPSLRFVQGEVDRLAELAELGTDPYDAALCLDAACYYPDRRRAFRQVAARLRPGGRLLVVDWCAAEDVTPLQRQLLLDPLARLWAVPDWETATGYRRLLTHAGLVPLDVEDLTDQARPEFDRGYRVALAAVGERQQLTDLVRLAATTLRHGPRMLQAAGYQLQVALLAKAGADAGCLRYVAALAEKPTA